MDLLQEAAAVAAADGDAAPASFAEIAAGVVAVGMVVAVVAGCMRPVAVVVGVAEIDVVADEAESSDAAAADIAADAAA